MPKIHIHIYSHLFWRGRGEDHKFQVCLDTRVRLKSRWTWPISESCLKTKDQALAKLSGKHSSHLHEVLGVKISTKKKQNCPLNPIQLLEPVLITYTIFNNHNPIPFKTEPHWGQQPHTTVKSQNKPVHQKQLHTKLRLPSLALHSLTTHLYMACHTQSHKQCK